MKIPLDKFNLRRPEPKDAEFFYEYKNDWQIIKNLGGFNAGYAIKDIHEWIECHRNKSDEIIWTIAENETDFCLGQVGLYKIDHRARNAEFGIMIGNKQWKRKGVGKMVSDAVVKFGFRQLNLHRIYANVLKTNETSVKFFEKIGFKYEGNLREQQFKDGHYIDVVVMGKLEKE